jgi:hypothetical protein
MAEKTLGYIVLSGKIAQTPLITRKNAEEHARQWNALPPLPGDCRYTVARVTELEEK